MTLLVADPVGLMAEADSPVNDVDAPEQVSTLNVHGGLEESRTCPVQYELYVRITRLSSVLSHALLRCFCAV